MQTQDVAIRPNVRVILKSDAEQLDEVVVTAMGIKRDRKALGHPVFLERLFTGSTQHRTAQIQ